MKKFFSAIAFSVLSFMSASILNCFNHIEKYEKVDAASLEKIETTAFAYIAGTSASVDAHLVIHLTENDYNGSQNLSYTDYKNKIDSLDFVNQILINGEQLNFETYNSQGFKYGSEIHINTLQPSDGTFSIRINFNGTTTDDIQSIRILKECEIPSEGYLYNTSNSIYTLKGNLTATPQDCNYDWATCMDTDVYGVSTVNNTYLGLLLTINDYPAPNGTVDGTIGDSFTTYHTGVTLDSGISVYNGYGLLSYNAANNAIWIRTSANSSTISSINVASGTILPSYHSVKASPRWPLYFRCVEAKTFEKNSKGVFPFDFDDVETEIEEVDFTSINTGWLSFKLSNSNYVTFRQSTFANSAQYNFWDKITIIDGSNNEYSLFDICDSNAHIFNFNNANVGEIAVNLVSPYSNVGTIKRIIVPAGTEFPDYDYITGTYTGIPKAYVTAQKQEFLYGTTNVFAHVLDTSVTAMGYNENGYLGFVLSNNDYPELGSTTLTMESYYANCNDVIDLSNIGLSFSHRYSLWSYGSLDDSVSPQVTGTLQYGIVYIPVGTLFPSYTYSQNTSSIPKVYRTTDNASFLYDGSKFIDISVPWTISNSIVSLETHGNIGTNDLAIDFMLDTCDWPNSVTDLDLINNTTYGNKQYKSIYNTFDKVKAYDKNGNLLPFTSEVFVNVWGKTRCISIRLVNPSIYMVDLSYILIKSGLELPTYGGFYIDESNGKYSDNSRYVIEDDYIFAFSSSNYVFVETDYVEQETSITAVEEKEQYTQNSIISLSLGTNDYSPIVSNFDIVNAYRTEFNKLNTANYITINGVKLANLEGFSNTNIYLSNDGTISIRTPGNNTGYYYINNTRVYTSDLTKYEIRIAKGCQFPSYDTLRGTAHISTCYTVSQDYSFAWFNGEYVLEDNSFNELEVEDYVVKNVGYCNVGGSDRSIYIPLTNTDWPLSSVVNKDIKNDVSCKDFLNHIEMYDVDDNLHLPLTIEIFINVWGTGSTVPSIGFRTDFNSASEIKSVIIHEGCLIPSYDKYLGNSDSWYLVRERQSFYSSKDGKFYLGSNLSEIEYAKEFNDAFEEVCTDYDGISSNLDALTNKFYAFENIYNVELSSEVKSNLQTSTNEEVLKMYSTYDYVVQKYNLNNFLNSDFSKNEVNKMPLSFSDPLSISLVISITSLLFLVGGAYFVRKKTGKK